MIEAVVCGLSNEDRSPKSRFLPELIETIVVMVFVVASIAWLGSYTANAAHTHLDETKYLIIHLDGVSSDDFFTMGEAGQIPHVWEYFSDGTKVRYGLTLFPGGTEIIYPRLKEGLDNSQSHMVGWGYLERESLLTFGDAHIFLEMFGTFPRISRSQFLTGLPVFEFINILDLNNIPGLFREYDVLEYFWFNTDVVGHLYGQEAHTASIIRFDRWLGELLQRPGMDSINVILYTDHGMSMGEMEPVDIDTLVLTHGGELVKFYSYPNIYLRNPSTGLQLAETLAVETVIDLAAAWVDDHTIRVFHSQGYADISYKDGLFGYYSFGEGPFGYPEEWNSGRWWDRDEWFFHTRDMLYPGAVPNLYQYLSNPFGGDALAILNPYKLPMDSIGHQGSHAGLHASDLLVPVLFRGPAFEHTAGLEQLWLHELYTVHVPGIPFSDRAVRLPQSFVLHRSLAADENQWGIGFRLSPVYRWQWGVEWGQEGQGWLAFDAVRTFWLRIWLGIGVADNAFQWYRSLDMQFGDFQLAMRWFGSQGPQYEADFALNEEWSLNLHSHRGLGLRWKF